MIMSGFGLGLRHFYFRIRLAFTARDADRETSQANHDNRHSVRHTSKRWYPTVHDVLISTREMEYYSISLVSTRPCMAVIYPPRGKLLATVLHGVTLWTVCLRVCLSQ